MNEYSKNNNNNNRIFVEYKQKQQQQQILAGAQLNTYNRNTNKQTVITTVKENKSKTSPKMLTLT